MVAPYGFPGSQTRPQPLGGGAGEHSITCQLVWSEPCSWKCGWSGFSLSELRPQASSLGTLGVSALMSPIPPAAQDKTSCTGLLTYGNSGTVGVAQGKGQGQALPGSL